MTSLRRVLLIVGIACTVVFLSVNYTRTITTGSDLSELRIGFQPSPWFKREFRDSGNSSELSLGNSSELNLLSWSSVFALAAVASFLGSARLGKARPA